MSYVVGTAMSDPTLSGSLTGPPSHFGQCQLSGEINVVTHSFSSSSRSYFPPGVGAIARKTPSVGNLGKRQYICGGHNANLLIDEEFRCLRQSIPAPIGPPTVTASAGSLTQIAYIRFYDELTEERGPLSAGTSFTGGVTRTWTNLPTTVPGDEVLISGSATFVAGVQQDSFLFGAENLRPGDRIADASATNRWARVRSISNLARITTDDTSFAGTMSVIAKIVSRVTHVELWVSVDGGLPRFATRVRLGTTTASDSTPTLALGEAEIESFTAMPFGSINVLYNSRQLIMGVVGREDTIFVSQFGFPERWGGLEFTTPYNEPIVGAFVYRKYVVILCPDSSYVLQGITDDDYVLEPLDADIGGIGVHASAEGVVFVPGRKGMQLFNGAFHRVIPTRRSEWTDRYVRDRLAYDTGFMAVNPNDETVRFFPNFPRYETSTSSASLYRTSVWVGQYSDVGPTSSGGVLSPEWFDDSPHTSADQYDYATAAAYLTPSGANAGKFYLGSSLGKIYEEDESGTVQFFGTSIIVPGHQLMGDFGGDLNEGKELVRVWSYVRCEESVSSWSLRIWPGDEYCYPTSEYRQLSIRHPSVADKWTDTVAATGASTSYPVPYSGVTYPGPKVIHVHPMVKRSGRGFTFEYRFTAPLDVVFIGLGGEFGPGTATRPLKEEAFEIAEPWS